MYTFLCESSFFSSRSSSSICQVLSHTVGVSLLARNYRGPSRAKVWWAGPSLCIRPVGPVAWNYCPGESPTCGRTVPLARFCTVFCFTRGVDQTAAVRVYIAQVILRRLCVICASFPRGSSVRWHTVCRTSQPHSPDGTRQVSLVALP